MKIQYSDLSYRGDRNYKRINLLNFFYSLMKLILMISISIDFILKVIMNSYWSESIYRA